MLCRSIAAALAAALRTDRLLVACGSLALVGSLRRALRERFGMPPPATAPLFEQQR